MRNKAHTTIFKKGEIVTVDGYDRWLKFRIKKGKRILYRVTHRDIELVDHPEKVLREKILNYLIRNTLADDSSRRSPEIAKAVGAPGKVVNKHLAHLVRRGILVGVAEPGRTGRSGKWLVQLSPYTRINRVTRLDRLLVEQDFLD